MAAIAYYILEQTIIVSQGPVLAVEVRPWAPNSRASFTFSLYIVGIGAAFVHTVIADLLYLGVALIWLVPDRRMETAIAGPRGGATPDG